MSKWFGARVASDAIHDIIVIFGHVGYSKDSPLEQRLRDCIGWEIGDGTQQIQKLVIAREIIGREAVA